MRLHEILKAQATLREEYDEYEDEDTPETVYPSITEIEALKPAMAKAAQEVYDDWDESDTDTYAGGGICHYIADDIVSILNGVYDRYEEDARKYTRVTASYAQHVYCVCIAKNARGRNMVYNIDIPHQYYETGGGFSWEKIPDVKFTPNMVHISEISKADNWENYINEF